jgi:hypothetical protein
LYTPALSAQTAPAPSAPEGWQFQVVPYLWGSGLDGGIGIGGRTADVDASFSNILDHLHFAAMGLVEAQRNQLVLLNDTIYVDVRGQRATPGPLFSGVRPEQKLLILTPEAGYRILGAEGASVDAVGGIRLWHLNSELQFQPRVLPGINVQASRNWVDAIVGLRAIRDLPRNWWARAYGDHPSTVFPQFRVPLFERRLRQRRFPVRHRDEGTPIRFHDQVLGPKDG